MRGGPSVVLLAVCLAASLTLIGCGGAQQDNSSQSREPQQARQEGGGAEQDTGKRAPAELESLSGRVERVFSDKDTVIIRPENGRPVIVRYRPDVVKITLDGEEAGPDAIREGQGARVGYVKKTNKEDKEKNIAHTIELEPATGAEQGE
ncbi:MAG TPA: hypothetical protein VHH10_04310 [Rubrobacteraceae bacterium]|nr:hypothetical protein [Rubrobacteraceae bacterium]